MNFSKSFRNTFLVILLSLIVSACAAKKTTTKFALATIYNTVHAFKKAGHLSEVHLRGKNNTTYFDTNISNHHHFYDISEKKLIDLDEVDVGPINIQKSIPGKKIKSVEVLVKLDTDNQ